MFPAASAIWRIMLSQMRTLLEVALVHALAVIAPGPDFAMILRNSIRGARTVVLATAMGIASGIALHSTYGVLGLTWVLQGRPRFLLAVQVLGGLYLVFQGLLGLWRQSFGRPVLDESAGPPEQSALWKTGWRQGFLTNTLNPGAMLFIVTVFVSFVTPQASVWMQVACAVEMVVATALWFGLLAVLLTRRDVRRRLEQLAPALTSGAAVALVFFGVRVLLRSRL